MPEKVVPGPVCDERSIREAVCIHTKKILDSCQSKDCLEDLRVYPTRTSQEIIDRAQSVKAKNAELLCAYIDLQPVGFNRGFYAVDVRYFYRITADAFAGAVRPVEVSGLAVFDKRAILFGGEAGAKIFTSEEGGYSCAGGTSLPIAELEAVDPMILNLKLVNVHDCRPCGPCDCGIAEIPLPICDTFGEDLMLGSDTRRLLVTLGQFSIIRLERDTHLLMPAYDYCLPEKECTGGGCCDGGCIPEDPCEVFRKVKFPVHEFFPTGSAISRESATPGCCQH